MLVYTGFSMEIVRFMKSGGSQAIKSVPRSAPYLCQGALYGIFLRKTKQKIGRIRKMLTGSVNGEN